MTYAIKGRLFKATLIGLTAIALTPAGSALARVGVTSAADGDPLGKPPNANERILRIGIDVQANELITTATNDRAHLVFLDGSSLTVGPNARLVLDKFVYDPNTQRGEIAVNATKGVLRLVGGKISKNTPITITTPSSTIGIRGGITVVSVTELQTIADFIFGTSMTVTGGGVTQTATRPGSQIIANLGSPPGAPTLLKPGSLNAALGQLEGTSGGGGSGSGGTTVGSNVERAAQNSGFTNQNSGRIQQSIQNLTNQNGPPNTTSNTLTTAISNSNPADNPVGQATLQNGRTDNGNPTPPPTPTSQTFTGLGTALVIVTRGGTGNGSEGSSMSTQVLPLPQPAAVSITTDPANSQAKGTIAIPVTISGQSGTASLQLGGVGGLGAQNSVFVDDKTYAMVTQTNDPTRLSSLQIGSQTTRLNDNTVLLSAAAAQAAVPGTSTCTCEFLTWGWWFSNVPDPRNNGTTYSALGNYVAGTLTTAVQMPQTGSATYNGIMVGVSNINGIASGNYSMNYNFASRFGVTNMTFDGSSYRGTVSGNNPSGTTFAGGFSGSRGTGSMNGAFYGPGARNQGGTFTIGNANSAYQAAGIFAGTR